VKRARASAEPPAHPQPYQRTPPHVPTLPHCNTIQQTGTFTKSFGSAGGYIAGSSALIAYLRRHCPAHLYATSMAPGVMEQISSAIKLLQVRA
jgi:7-keto-8-aminopelargonate synthetase-like enzyme